MDLVVASKFHPIELGMVSGIGTISGAIDIFGRAKGAILVQAPAPKKIKTHYDGTIDLTLFNTRVKDGLKAPMVGASMEGNASISVQP